MRKIYSEYNNVSDSSVSGDSLYNVYERVVNKNTGEVSLIVNKVLDLYNEIQEAGIGTTLQELIDKYESGEFVDFNFRQGQYLDLSELPSSAVETLNLLKNIDNLDVINDYLRSLNTVNEKEKKDDLDNQIVLDVNDGKNKFELNDKGENKNEKKIN
ncbi:MAG: hypothetical protein OHM56_10000 [Spiroplasma phoeniceum]|nr:MAG: hypothetical protein OHM57_09415 [Spiroplasma phoeniceum]UZQ31906.1 MAG: hypothetical protein OHM56_10000 [Spiroplasma phoeniceum]